MAERSLDSVLASLAFWLVQNSFAIYDLCYLSPHQIHIQIIVTISLTIIFTTTAFIPLFEYMIWPREPANNIQFRGFNSQIWMRLIRPHNTCSFPCCPVILRSLLILVSLTIPFLYPMMRSSALYITNMLLVSKTSLLNRNSTLKSASSQFHTFAVLQAIFSHLQSSTQTSFFTLKTSP
jgi:hypothetical protein